MPRKFMPAKIMKFVERKEFSHELKLANLAPVFKKKGEKTSVENYSECSTNGLKKFRKFNARLNGKSYR